MKGRYLINFDSRGLPCYETELLVIGSGIAGLYTAWKAAEIGLKPTVLTKGAVDDTNSGRAQGGIAAALGETDSPDLHYQDTILAGAGLCDSNAVKILVNEGPERVQELINMGANFDRRGRELAMTQEGAHSKRRILHADGDATGAEIMRALAAQVTAQDNIELLEQYFVIDLLVDDNICHGVLVFDENSGRCAVFWSRAVVLASGGAGQLYQYTTNPEVATGDGIAFAYRAGAEVMDMEFVQFHPTALVLPGAPRFLISEAVRGEGAKLRNSRGERFMPRYHHMAELAPRDIVSRSIIYEMVETGEGCVYLDLTGLSSETIKKRFPTITGTCARYGLDITRELIPVAPAAHYLMGGVKTNCHGETSVYGLYACGETACQGVHGANRLASNSLLDGLVFGKRIADRVRNYIRWSAPEVHPHFSCQELHEPVSGTGFFTGIKEELKHTMSENVGPLRNRQKLIQAQAFFDQNSWLQRHCCRGPREMEMCNMLEVGRLITQAAVMRTESRGGHFRLDFPETLSRWQKHIIIKR